MSAFQDMKENRMPQRTTIQVTQIANEMEYLVKLTFTNQICKMKIHIRVTFLNLGHNPN
jgi:hypothetical protein